MIFLVTVSVKAVNASDAENNIAFITDEIEFALEIMNLAIAIGVAVVALFLTRSLKGSQMARGWNIIVAAVLVFAVFEVYNVNRAVGFLHIGGFGDVLEFIFVGLLFLGFVTIYRAYQED